MHSRRHPYRLMWFWIFPEGICSLLSAKTLDLSRPRCCVAFPTFRSCNLISTIPSHSNLPFISLTIIVLSLSSRSISFRIYVGIQNYLGWSWVTCGRSHSLQLPMMPIDVTPTFLSSAVQSSSWS
ncbi:hypothetical protein BO99DRAFT_16570 [Aspergillus violaceofuscus CBS 115571]|uniref:Secreted protein n=1 Tax=Aspergillus violaceofuscus (strain CBS 115571) TaxID=1450538 RepID=A0A2V5GYX8_ASPV1|nr:hypothetical protein BO99DRAFT_16570 [Aspergillus violaceofuscus CBS 115571]